MIIHKGDNVQIISGKDRGKRGKVIQVLPNDGRVVIDGLNLMTKNVRPRRANEKGQVVRFNAPLDASNVQLICPKCGKLTRVGHERAEKKKLRQCRKCKETFA
jgi:large subunit ribosomal protein L24